MAAIKGKQRSSSAQRKSESASTSNSASFPSHPVSSNNNDSEDDDNDDDDDDAPEEQTNASTKKAVNLNKEKEIAQKRKLKAVRQAAQAKSKKESKKSVNEDELVSESKGLEDEELANEEAVEEDAEDQTTSNVAGSSNPISLDAAGPKRLDPALFAATFSETSSNVIDAKTATEKGPVNGLYKVQERRRKAKRKGGIVQGRDGQPMKRLNDGRTTVRVLEKRKFENDDDQKIEEVINKPESMNELQSSSMKRARRYKKNKLGLKGTQSTIEPVSRSLKPKIQQNEKSLGKGKKKSEEDPLGLEDPAFMKGGEMSHLGLSAISKSKKGSQTKSKGKKSLSTLRRGDAGRRGPTGTSRFSVPLQFVRSQS